MRKGHKILGTEWAISVRMVQCKKLFFVFKFYFTSLYCVLVWWQCSKMMQCSKCYFQQIVRPWGGFFFFQFECFFCCQVLFILEMEVGKFIGLRGRVTWVHLGYDHVVPNCRFRSFKFFWTVRIYSLPLSSFTKVFLMCAQVVFDREYRYSVHYIA